MDHQLILQQQATKKSLLLIGALFLKEYTKLGEKIVRLEKEMKVMDLKEKLKNATPEQRAAFQLKVKKAIAAKEAKLNGTSGAGSQEPEI